MRKLIWTCRGGGCGGYADRLKGIVTAYLLAKAVGREFFIEWDGITNLQECFDVPCAFDGARVQGAENLRLVDCLEHNINPAIGMLFDMKQETVYISANQYDELHCRALGNGQSMPETFARVLNRLMTPTAAITIHPEYLKAAKFLTSHTAGVQVRTGEQNYPHEHDLKRIDTRKVWGRVLLDDLTKVFIASDSPRWKDDFAAVHPEIPSHQIRFVPAHIERSVPEDIRRTFLLTVIEHQILSKCSRIYTGWGGFGRTAAWWGQKPYIDLLTATLANAGGRA